MAETVTWDRLRELAEFRAEKGCAISLYLDLNPKNVPTAGDADARVSSLLAEGERHAGADGRGLTHDQRVALRADFDVIGILWIMQNGPRLVVWGMAAGLGFMAVYLGIRGTSR